MFYSGQRLTCECDYASITGYLDRDEVDLDGVFVVISDDDGKRYKIKGWLWSVELEASDDPFPAPNRPTYGNMSELRIWQAAGPLPLY